MQVLLYLYGIFWNKVTKCFTDPPKKEKYSTLDVNTENTYVNTYNQRDIC